MQEKDSPPADGAKPKRRGPPRKSKLEEPAIRQAILDSVRLGTPLAAAAEAARIHRGSVYDWLRLGEKAKADGKVTRHSMFLDDYTFAKSEAIDRLVTVVGNDAVDNPETAKWLLTKLDPKNFADRLHVAVTEELNAALDRLQVALTPEQFIIVARILAGEPGETAVELPAGGPIGPTATAAGGAPTAR